MKKSEKQLLFALLGLVLLGAGVIASDVYFDKRAELTSERTQLNTDWIEIQILFEDKELWEMRANWLNQNQPAFTSSEQIAQAIFKDALAEEETGFTTSKQNLLPNDRTPDYIQAGVTLIAQGELPSFMRWAYDLTRPESFRVISNLKLTPDKEEEGRIVAQMELLRWYAPPEL